MIRNSRKSNHHSTCVDAEVLKHDKELDEMLLRRYPEDLTPLQRSVIIELTHRYGDLLGIRIIRRIPVAIVTLSKDRGCVSPEGKILTLTEISRLIRRYQAAISAELKAYGPTIGS